ncbi:MAG: glycine--tRNA ligase, partial [Candidatus Thermoplasmatota archaeon]
MEKELYKDVNSLAKRRGFIWNANEIYGGSAGFYDYGPLGAMVKENIENLWREYYVYDEGFCEISSTSISPDIVFKASGHLDKFTDTCVECEKCGESFKVDNLVGDIPEGIGKKTLAELGELIKEKGI